MLSIRDPVNFGANWEISGVFQHTHTHTHTHTKGLVGQENRPTPSRRLSEEDMPTPFYRDAQQVSLVSERGRALNNRLAVVIV